jgi:hypothetical protein
MMTAFFEVACACLVSFISMCINVPMSLHWQAHEALLLVIDPTNWSCAMLELQYPLIDRFNADHAASVNLFHSRFPNALIPYIGPAFWDISYSFPLFNNQDAWC